jgi:hypothetical protein
MLFVCVSPPLPEPIVSELDMYITATEPISTADFIDPYHLCLCLHQTKAR